MDESTALRRYAPFRHGFGGVSGGIYASQNLGQMWATTRRVSAGIMNCSVRREALDAGRLVFVPSGSRTTVSPVTKDGNRMSLSCLFHMKADAQHGRIKTSH